MALSGETAQAAREWVWLPDDTEESVVGSMRHQDTIRDLARLLRRLRDQEQAPWDVGTQLGLHYFTRPDGSHYTPMPDVFVHPCQLPQEVTSITLAEYGLPWLIVEVASPTTVAADLGEKAQTYVRGGVGEYLIFDAGERFIPGQVRAHRRGPDGGLVPWAPEADGRWHSRTVPLALAPEGVLLRVYDRVGRAVPLDTEQEQQLRHAEWQAQRAEWQAQEEARRREEEAAQRRLAEGRAQEEARLRQEEARLRQEAEARLAALEDELRRLRGERD